MLYLNINIFVYRLPDYNYCLLSPITEIGYLSLFFLNSYIFLKQKEFFQVIPVKIFYIHLSKNNLYLMNNVFLYRN